jgi:cell wall-associated NlpC family hydrolase
MDSIGSVMSMTGIAGGQYQWPAAAGVDSHPYAPSPTDAVSNSGELEEDTGNSNVMPLLMALVQEVEALAAMLEQPSPSNECPSSPQPAPSGYDPSNPGMPGSPGAYGNTTGNTTGNNSGTGSGGHGSSPSASSAPNATTNNNLGASPSANGIVGTADRIASQGLPYKMGAEGPNAYDCSGFTQTVYRANGIHLPRLAQEQYNYCKNQGTLVADSAHDGGGMSLLANAKPGDLLFFDNPYPSKVHDIGHVMIYLGNGKMVGAQDPGVKQYKIGDMAQYLRAVGRPH